jgi:hypothetical protein
MSANGTTMEKATNGLEGGLVELRRELADERLRWALPEYLRANLTSGGGVEVTFVDAEAAEANGREQVARADALFLLLNRYLETFHPEWRELSTREKYRALPRTTRVEKMLAQVYRLLKVVHGAVTERAAHVVPSSGKIAITVSCGVAHALTVTPMGLTLLGSFVAYYLTSLQAPFSEAYLEAMLSQYYADITEEVCRFFDEDGVLLQFRRKGSFDRHCRLRCPNPKFAVAGEEVVFQIGTHLLESRRSIDFYVILGGMLHIVPSEALQGDRVPLAELERWRARGANDAIPYGGSLRLEQLHVADSGPMA